MATCFSLFSHWPLLVHYPTKDVAERDGGEGWASQHQAGGGVVAHREVGQARGYAGMTMLAFLSRD